MNKFDTLDDWLAWQETLNPAEIDLGLDRLHKVMHQGNIADCFDCPLIIVAGTNGKGSTVAFIEAIATAAGRKVCAYTSPHILRYNERIRIAGQAVSDNELCAAFERIDAARGDVPLTYFEFGTLAAIDLFHNAVSEGGADLVVMEIGLGGRLDAVNVMQPDVSVITSIALDHTDWLGETRAEIAVEKAGVMRTGRTTVIGDWQPPQSLYEVAHEVAAKTLSVDRDFFIASSDDDWSLMLGDDSLYGLPHPALAGEHQYGNAACAIVALDRLAPGLRIDRRAIEQGLREVALAGRLQRSRSARGAELLFDVAHNPQAIEALIDYCGQRPVEGRTLVVLAMLRDKPVPAVVAALAQITDAWYIAGLDSQPRGLAADELERLLSPVSGDGKLSTCEDVSQAYELALVEAGIHDRVIVTGSFHTVAEALASNNDTD